MAGALYQDWENYNPNNPTALRPPSYWDAVKENIPHSLRGLSRVGTNALGLPVDIVNLGLDATDATYNLATGKTGRHLSSDYPFMGSRNFEDAFNIPERTGNPTDFWSEIGGEFLLPTGQGLGKAVYKIESALSPSLIKQLSDKPKYWDNLSKKYDLKDSDVKAVNELDNMISDMGDSVDPNYRYSVGRSFSAPTREKAVDNALSDLKNRYKSNYVYADEVTDKSGHWLKEPKAYNIDVKNFDEKHELAILHGMKTSGIKKTLLYKFDKKRYNELVDKHGLDDIDDAVNIYDGDDFTYFVSKDGEVTSSLLKRKKPEVLEGVEYKYHGENFGTFDEWKETTERFFNEPLDNVVTDLSKFPAGSRRSGYESLEEFMDDVPNIIKETDKIVDIPIESIKHGESAMSGGKLSFSDAQDRIKRYADMNTDFPPIELMPNDDGTFMIYDGSHRLEAAKLRGDKTIKSVIPKTKIDPRPPNRFYDSRGELELKYSGVDSERMAKAFREGDTDFLNGFLDETIEMETIDWSYSDWGDLISKITSKSDINLKNHPKFLNLMQEADRSKNLDTNTLNQIIKEAKELLIKESIEINPQRVTHIRSFFTKGNLDNFSSNVTNAPLSDFVSKTIH